ncbi:MAG: hypothetical protein EA350_02590 [Gemmatimonadales bacterium]|nr:MAG: hypothetical protein EA350_02590 [Gemmatimonadales bacterium]
MSILAILGLVAALLLGLYLGMPTRYEADWEEIEEALSDETRERHKVERKTTFLTLMQRNMMRGSDRRRTRGGRRPFQLDQDDR